MRALRLKAWKSDPVLEEVPVPSPGPGEVLVQVGAAGACHSDLHLMREFDEGLLPWAPPFTLGHENAGWVHTLGEGVTGLEPGQPVAVVGAWGCGTCSRCLDGLETYCERPDLAPVPGGGGGLGLDGGMAEYLLVPGARHLVPLPEGLDPVQAAPLTDAGLTPYHAVRRSAAKLVPGSTAVVIGAGGLGHLGVQVLRATTAARVVVVDPRDAARDLAVASGADHAFAPGPDTVQAIRELTGGVGADVVLDFVGSDDTLALAAASMRQVGDLTIVGIAGGTLPVSFFGLPYEVSVQTTYWGNRRELVEVLDLGARGLLRAETTLFTLDDAAEAYRQLEHGTIRGRAVVVPNDSYRA
ncbi:propanol-preferring alcohol dehydrogenase [Nocardioides ginsengisegetis]|uniref:alcohol dehydrogenase n=1 Tax=Nocardioides ginsengisegetis TaxID=661491 RepID=A0A7W3P9H5_9ACTN|nr:NAD(P)-dependent alcohol dehydrogenase [Nocardioides ginsengisegetis]MBA8803456.1 propanol-preferring alcohol dehydrogenase [Nocardioides ginsengisegetis]